MKEIDRRIVSWDQLPGTIEALNKLQLEYDVQKRYMDEKRASVVGVAQYTVILYSRNGDDRKRFD